MYDDIIEDQFLNLTNILNLGRDRTAINNCDKAEYYSILDKRTCPLCQSLDGMVVNVNSSEYKKYMPPMHSRCRCIYVYIDREETRQPRINIPEIDLELLIAHGYMSNKNYIDIIDEATIDKIIDKIFGD